MGSIFVLVISITSLCGFLVLIEAICESFGIPFSSHHIFKICLMLIFFYIFITGENTFDSQVLQCKQECRNGYQKAKQKLRKHGLKPGQSEENVFMACKRQCEINPDF